MQIDHIHFYVEDAIKWRNWFQKNLYFHSLITKISQHTHTEIITSGAIQFRLSSPLNATSPVADFLAVHPPGVIDIALVIEDLDAAIDRITTPSKILHQIEGNQGIKSAKVAGWGTLNHTLLEKKSYPSPDATTNFSEQSPYLGIDHLVLNVPKGELSQAVQWYQQVFQLQLQQEFVIKTASSGLYSQVLVHPITGFQLPINEPTSSNSQIQEFLDLNQGAGIQHLALQVTDLIQAVTKIRINGLKFLQVAADYYQQLLLRSDLPLQTEEFAAIKSQDILIDWRAGNSQSLLLQIFTQPIFSQPTFFLELIERRSRAQGFGAGNFQALFMAMEAEQLRRRS